MTFSASAYLDALSRVMDRIDRAEVEAAIGLVERSWIEGRRIFACGNGGSALTASHYIHEWNKMAYLAEGRPFRGHCLSDNVGLVTAYANDMSYDDIYSEQLKNQMEEGDLLIGISGSGNSENVVRAIEYANEVGGTTLAVCGFDGGKLKRSARHAVWVRSFDMQLCEDMHVVFGHMVMKALCGDSVRD
ncbi:MAG TPA: SIS domain-containing protein [Deltaproteobacteria bacterium]|nr:SIS domain-containing protein [Deltaproteobacteria bacterium]